MSSGDQGFDTTEFTAGPENRDRMAAGYKTPHEQRQSHLFCSAFNYASPSIMKRIELLRGIQSKHDEVKAEFLKERAKLEAKYQTVYQYFYAKRYHIVNGLVEVDGDRNKGTDSEDDGEKGIPNFWLIAMKNNDVTADEIFEKDEGALGYLKDIKWRRIENPKGFRLDFFFNTNPYFKNSVLTKIYYMIDEDEPILKNAIGTKIEWHPGNCLALRIEKEPNTAVGLEERQSFFDFFNPPQVPARRWDVDNDTADKLQKKMEQDYDVATTIRDKIIPHAVSWFTGEAEGIAYSSDEDEDDDDDDDEQDDEDSFDE